jgi:hypothetical protein
MNIDSTAGTSTGELWQLLASSQSFQANSASNASSNSAVSSSDASSLSGPGQLFKELESLSKSDPAEFKKITGQIANQLQNAASQSTNSSEATFLNQLATAFSNASQTGNFSSLFGGDSQGLPGNTTAASATEPYSSASSSSTGSNGQNAGDTLMSVFAQALSQIQSDLSSAGTINN